METIPEVIKNSVNKNGKNVALYFKKDNQLNSMTYNELDRKATQLSIALIENLGVEKGEHIALISNNRPEWIMCNLGIIYTGAADVPRGSDTPDEILQNIIKHSDARIAIIENEEVLKKMGDAEKNLEAIIIMDEKFKPEISGNEKVHSLAEFLDYGSKNMGSEKKVLDRISQLKGEDLASIIYTSGTTGSPKGAMLTHKNYMHNIKHVPNYFSLSYDDKFLTVLPSWHAYERMCEYMMLSLGGLMHYGSIMTLKNDFLEAKPIVVAFIPELWTVLYKLFMNEIESQSTFKKKLAKMLIGFSQSYAHAKRIINNEEPIYSEMPDRDAELEKRKALQSLGGFVPSKYYLTPAFKEVFYSIMHKLAQKLIFSQLKQKLGGRLRIAASGAGPLPENIDEFYSAAGLPISEGYGITETMVVISIRDQFHNKIKTVGMPLPEIETKIVDKSGNEIGPGQIGILKVRGPNVMKGYYKNPELTAKVIDAEGWYDTGDLAKKTIDDYLKIMGRKDDVLVLTTGDKVNAMQIENELKGRFLIENAVVVGQNKPYITALIYLNKAELKKFAEKNSIKYENLDKLAANPLVRKEIYETVDKLTSNPKKFAPYEKIKGIKLSVEELRVGIELSETMKLKRNKFYEMYAEEINELYKK